MTAGIPVVTVDGPSGVGKGTLSRALARTLGWHWLDSGALYRLTALAALDAGAALDDAAAVAALAAELDVRFEPGAEEDQVWLAGLEVTRELRTETCGDAASRVAALPAVREALLQRQRDFRRPPGLVADGRDMGTVVFPDAKVKIFLTASPQERAKRRYKQLREKGINASLAALVNDIAERDRRDAQRAVSPLVPAPDAITLDTTGLGIAEVRERALALVRR